AEPDPAHLRLQPHARGRPAQAHFERDPGLRLWRRRFARYAGSGQAEVGEVGGIAPGAVDDMAGGDEGLDAWRLALFARHRSSRVTVRDRRLRARRGPPSR